MEQKTVLPSRRQRIKSAIARAFESEEIRNHYGFDKIDVEDYLDSIVFEIDQDLPEINQVTGKELSDKDLVLIVIWLVLKKKTSDKWLLIWLASIAALSILISPWILLTAFLTGVFLSFVNMRTILASDKQMFRAASKLGYELGDFVRLFPARPSNTAADIIKLVKGELTHPSNRYRMKKICQLSIDNYYW